MHPLTRFVAAIVATVASGLSTAAHAGSLSDFNLIVLGNLGNVTDVEGRVFVGGNLNANTSEYGTKLTASDYAANPSALVVLGSMSPTTKNKEQYKVYGDLQYDNSTLNQNNQDVVGYHQFGGTKHGTTYSLGDVMTETVTLSAQLRNLAPTAAASLPGAQPAAAKFVAGPGTSVFNITGSNLFSNNKVQQIELALNDADHVIINVAGTTINFNQGNFVGAFNTDLGRGKVIWNFFEATTLNFDRAFDGMILAPYASLTTNHVLSGQVVVNHLLSNSEVHLPLNDISPMTVVPTPTAAATGIVLLGVTVLCRRRA